MIRLYRKGGKLDSSGYTDLYGDPRHYDAKNSAFNEDIPFYNKLLKDFNGSVLELTCGTGRLAIPFAMQGVDISGIDNSVAMLEHAKKKAIEKKVDIDFIMADVRNFHLHKKFDLILFPFNSIAHLLTHKDLTSCFGCVREHLSDTGRFVIDMFKPNLEILQRDPEQWYGQEDYPDPDGGTVSLTEQFRYDQADQIAEITWRYKLSRGVRKPDIKFKMRIYFPQELDALLNHCGFEIVSKFGNYDMSPFQSDSPKQLIISRRV